MKNLKLLLLTMLIGGLFYNCEFDDLCVRGEGPTVREEFNLPLTPITEVHLDMSADVYITQGTEQRVVVEGEQNIIDLLDFNVRNGRWVIDLDRRCVRSHDLRIYITTPSIDKITVNGSGNVRGENTIEGERIILDIDGSGDIELDLDMERVEAGIDGSGDMKLTGVTEFFDCSVSGSGDIKAFDLEALEARAQIRGSGSIELYVLDYLDASVDGSGDIYYRGDPDIDQSVSGSGRIRRR